MQDIPEYFADTRKILYILFANVPFNQSEYLSYDILTELIYDCLYAMGNRLIFFIIGLFLFFQGKANAQLLPIRIFNVQDGLSQSEVKTIVQDSVGYLWLGTADGLSRFDGTTFKNFSIHNGLSGNNITTAYMDGDSLIWFGLAQNGITIYNQKTRKFTPFTYNDSIYPNAVTSITRSKDGAIWIGTLNKGLLRYDGQKLEFLMKIKNSPITNKNITHLIIDAQNNLWIGTFGGITIINPQKYLQGGSTFYLTPKRGFPAYIIKGIVFDPHGNVWIGTQSRGLIKASPIKGKAYAYTYKIFDPNSGFPDSHIRSLFLSKNGELWVGTFNGVVQISHLDAPNPNFYVITTANGLGHNRVDAICEDYEGNIWFGTWGGGACQYTGRYFETYTEKDGLPDKNVWAIYEDSRHTIWFGTEKGLAGFKEIRKTKSIKRTHLFTKSKNFPAKFIFCIIGDGRDGLWLGTNGNGLVHFNPYSGEMQHYSEKQGLPSNVIISLGRDRQNNLWIATLDSGLAYLNIKTGKIKKYNTKNGLPTNGFFQIYKDKRGHFWFASKGKGILRFDGKGFKHFANPTSPFPCTVTSLTQDHQGNFWFGTKSNGVIVIKPGVGIIHHFDQTNGLSGDNIFGILIDDANHVWIGDKGGLNRYDPVSKTFKHFGVADGFLGLEPNLNAALKDASNHLWFGTINGAVRFLPEFERSVYVPPKIIINKIRLFYAEDSIPENHKFSYNKNHLTFNFTGFSFTDAKKLKYSFKLVGFDKNWSPPSKVNSATYSNLPPGKYTFLVKAQNAQGQWSKYPAQFSFEILPPFWDHWYFTMGVLLMFALLVYGYLHIRTAQVQRRNRLLEEKVKQRTAELEKQTNNLARAYVSLKESETKFRTLTEVTTSAVFIYQKTRFIYANHATLNLTGYTLDELLQLNFWDVVHPDFKEVIKERGLARQRGEKVPDHYEFKIIRKNGEERWVDFSSRQITFNGKPAALGTAYDITDRKKAEEALKESELQLRTLINAMPDIVCFKDGEGRWIEANEFDLKLFQIENVPYKGKKDSELAEFSPFFKDAFLACERSDEEAWKAKQIFRTEEIIFQPDGSSKIFDVIKVPIFNEDGSRKGLVVIGRDITEMKQVEEALRSEKERLDAILRSIHEGVIATDEKGNILFMNQYAEQILKVEEITHSPINITSTGKLYTLSKKEYDIAKACENIRKGNSIHSTEPFILKTAKGHEYLIEFNCAPIIRGKNKIIGSVVTFRDVSEKHKLEQELFKARKLESLAILAGGLAHDFNNILTAIIGNISLIKLRMQNANCPEKLMQLLIKAEQASMRAQGLTQQLLTFSKGGAPIKKAATIKELITSTVEFALRGSKIRYEIDLPDDLWPVEIDEGQISQVVNNLTINAMQAMPKGGKFYVKGENVKIGDQNIVSLAPGRYIKISFRDTGVGITPENLHRIFDPYFTTKKTGSGLGLASTYSIIKKHGGHILVESKPGEGTTFTFYLPASKKHVKQIVEEGDIYSIPTVNARVLVMDDEAEIRELIKEVLENMGMEVLTCADGKTAIEIYQKEMQSSAPIDLVILDLTVPGELGGKETLNELLKIDPKVKAIVSSGYSNDPIMSEYKKYGFKGVVSKPYQVNELIVTVQNVLGQ